MAQYCKCKIQNAPIYKRIKGRFCFVCHLCGKIRQREKSRIEKYLEKEGDYLTISDSSDWELPKGSIDV